MEKADLLLLGLGALAGLAAGLFGIGGGLILVPGLSWWLASRGVDPALIPKIALGTSLTSIVFTAMASVRAHAQRGQVHWPVVWGMAVWMALGTWLGAQLGARLPAQGLQWVFLLYTLWVARLMWQPPQASATPATDATLLPPPHWSMASMGMVIGLVSSWVGIGGGTMTVPYLSAYRVPLRRAIGTSAALGLPIALGGGAGYVWAGWHMPPQALPEGTWGWVHVHALVPVVLGSVLCAPLGAKLAQKLPVARLKRLFALLLLLMAAQMAWKILR